MSAQILEATDISELLVGAGFGTQSRLSSPKVGRADESEDIGLVHRVTRRDAKGFEIPCERYHTPLRRFIDRVSWLVEQVDEIVNDVMMVVWQKAETFNQTSKVSTSLERQTRKATHEMRVRQTQFGVRVFRRQTSRIGMWPGRRSSLATSVGLHARSQIHGPT